MKNFYISDNFSLTPHGKIVIRLSKSPGTKNDLHAWNFSSIFLLRVLSVQPIHTHQNGYDAECFTADGTDGHGYNVVDQPGAGGAQAIAPDNACVGMAECQGTDHHAHHRQEFDDQVDGGGLFMEDSKCRSIGKHTYHTKHHQPDGLFHFELFPVQEKDGPDHCDGIQKAAAVCAHHQEAHCKQCAAAKLERDDAFCLFALERQNVKGHRHNADNLCNHFYTSKLRQDHIDTGLYQFQFHRAGAVGHNITFRINKIC